MNQEGVTPTPPANPGSSSGQPAAGAPAPTEAQPAESKPFGAPASGAAPKDNRVPLERFQQVHQRMKEAEAKLADFEVRDRAVPAEPVARPGYQEQIEGWEQVAAKAYGSNPQEFTHAINQMSSLQAKAAASEMMEKMLSHQSEEAAQVAFEREQAAAWEAALQEFPELRDTSSELYRASAELWMGDPDLQRSALGMYRAAEIMFGRRARGGGISAPPPPLEGASASAQPNLPATPGQQLKKEYDQAVEGLQSGNLASLDNFLENNLDKILYDDGRKGQ